MNGYEFMDAHPLLTVILAFVAASIVSRLYRVAMVAARGWPPAHLDADGDWKKED
ncbi:MULTISPECIES: hypothetical protein [Burkholderia]|uniref:hypothetical protein n=1 Tax=Burkholderia TaxID=32008 RepID=UPI0018C3849F|nr:MULTISPECIES: hypothetical protein [Burkholderia]MBG0871866.1 hypothetical protein [Burkholderia sp. 9777_1386]MBR7969089.1 hypothetical protein [Burkholderia cenocepacia]